jgi:D-serine dehydratase
MMVDSHRPALDWSFKALPPRAEGLRAEELASLGLDLLADQIMLPAAVLRESRLLHNRRWMRDFMQLSGIRLCPHGKTTMSPEIFRMQQEDGVWGFTAATAHHVRIYRHLGVQRVFLANQLVGGANIDYVLGELESDPGFDFYCLVDSLDSVRLLDEASQARRLSRPLQVLVEVGALGGRTGVRTLAAGVAVAEQVAAAPRLALRGIEAFEGILQTLPDGVDRAVSMLDLLNALAVECAGRGLFSSGTVILSAGGSGLFDLCATALSSSPLSGRTQIVLRSGCYITHDSGLYERLFDQLRRRRPDIESLGAGLVPALEVWAHVQSVPEPGRLIAGLGKRDVSYDVEPPRPLWWYRRGAHDRPQPVPPGYAVSTLYDQHAYVDGPADFFRVGDLLGFGISHPCTTFDKWRMMLIVDDAYRVKSAITTLF